MSSDPIEHTDEDLRGIVSRALRDRALMPQAKLTGKRATAASRKGVKLPPHTLTRDECEAMIKACPSWSYLGRRARVAIALLWRCGLRANEVCALHKIDLDLGLGTLRVRKGKGGKYRLIGMDNRTCRYLMAYMQELPEKDRASAYVFPNRAGDGPWGYSSFWNLIRGIGEKAKIEKRVHPHAFRHTFASELRREKTDIGIISKALGHSSISHTSRYLDHIAPEEVIQNMQRRQW